MRGTLHLVLRSWLDLRPVGQEVDAYCMRRAAGWRPRRAPVVWFRFVVIVDVAIGRPAGTHSRLSARNVLAYVVGSRPTVQTRPGQARPAHSIATHRPSDGVAFLARLTSRGAF